MNKDFDVKEAVRSGNLGKINDWFCDRIWKYGRLYDPDKLFESVCGKFDPDAYINYLEKKFTEVYGL
jgi:carboxypeptidase Taq